MTNIEKKSLRQAMAERVLVLDGAMGTMIQSYGLGGNNDALVLDRPDVISEIHRRYLEAGADIISTCTFNAQSISQAEYGLQHRIPDLNLTAARLARQAADEFGAYVAGSVGPTTVLLSMESGNAAEAFDRLETAYIEQMCPLIAGGVDALLIETSLDTLNAKAALCAARKAMQAEGRVVELMVSLTVNDTAGHILSGMAVEAAAIALDPSRLLSIGLNCSLGAQGLIVPLRRLEAASDSFVSVHPNAGLPNQLGQYDETPQETADAIRKMLDENLVNVVGGCCGTTPQHIAAIRRVVDEHNLTPRMPRTIKGLRLAGNEAFSASDAMIVVGERCNVAGSRKFLRLINEEDYESALEIARKQVADGAMVIDLNMDDALLDSPAVMERFIRLLASDADTAAVPIMIDSSKFDVIERALKALQGKGIVNSISLKDGEEEFLRRARIVHNLGAAVIVMAFDEEGQATTLQRRIDICARAYKLLTRQVGFSPDDIVFDPNILTVATGMDTDLDYAYDFVEAVKWIKKNLPGSRVSGGLSNLSFAFRGNNALREAMHAIFLDRAVDAGLDMAIMNPAASVAAVDVDPLLAKAIADALFDVRTPQAVDLLISMAEEMKTKKTAAEKSGESHQTILPLEQRLSRAVAKGSMASLAEDLQEALNVYGSPLEIISGPLMQGIDEVGRLFGEGKIFLPQVVKSARVMKEAVEILRPYIDAGNAGISDSPGHKAGKVLIATVKGDVHDIGKNIVAMIMRCNGYDVFDLGVMVPPEDIVSNALEYGPDIICLSGLITPSLDAMCLTVRMLAEAGVKAPVMIGGATTSALHTAVKIAPEYPGLVLHMRDAAQNPIAAARLLDPVARDAFSAEIRQEQRRLRSEYELKKGVKQDETPNLVLDWETYKAPKAPQSGCVKTQLLPVAELVHLIDWPYFYHAWKVKEESPEAKSLLEDAYKMLAELSEDPAMGVETLTLFVEARGEGDSIAVGDVLIPTPREYAKPGRKVRRALADYVSPHGEHIGIFATTVSRAFVSRLEELKRGTDEYGAMLMHTLGDRLVEAASQWLHNRLVSEYGWSDIRPAVGYPTLPDQKAIFALDDLASFGRIGISLTETGAMYPASAVAGLYIARQDAEYFDARQDL